MVTGEINSLEGIRTDSLKIANDQTVELRIMLSPADLRYVFYMPESKGVVRMGIIASNNRSWSASTLNTLFSELKKELPPSGMVFCDYSGVPFAAIPSVIADKSVFSDILSITHGEADQLIAERKLDASEAVLIYRLDKAWKEGLNSVFPSASIDLHAAGLIEEAMSCPGKNSRPTISLNRGADFLDIILCDAQSKLIFANSFMVGNAEDCLYYLSSVIETHAIDPSLADMQIQGDLEADDILHRSLSKYFPGMKLQVLKPEVQADGFPPQALASILGPQVCV